MCATRAHFFFSGDLQDGTRVCMVFNSGNIATWKVVFVCLFLTRPYLLR